MNDLVLNSIEINNFRSIRGKVHAPLDAKVVLVHGENGAGKTSLLSAIELALTGKVQSLERADPNYSRQLLHRSADEGSVQLKVMSGAMEERFKAVLNTNGARSIAALDEQRANSFRERAFLPQSMLGQLLQIYQDAGNDASSPLAQFVSELLGLDRLDALENGLHPLADVRNVRKTVDGWLETENEKSRLARLLSDQRKTRDKQSEAVLSAISDLSMLCAVLGLTTDVKEETLNDVAAALSDSDDSEKFARLTDQQRRLASIRREIDTAQNASGPNAAITAAGADEAGKAFSRWESDYGVSVSAFRRRVESFLPEVTLPSDPEEFAEAALSRLHMDQKHLSERVSKARTDIARHALAQDELNVALRQLVTMEKELAQISESAGSLGSMLAELTSFISGEICPVCDRDFSEVGDVPLSQHIHGKVRTLSASAERLLIIGRARSELQVIIDRLNREIEVIFTRKLEEKKLAELDRLLASVQVLRSEVESSMETLRAGGRLRRADIAARRAVSEAQSRQMSLASAFETLSEFALSIRAPALEEGQPFETAAAQLEALLLAQAARLEERLSLRRKGAEHIVAIRSAAAHRQEADELIVADNESWLSANQALERAQVLRDQGNEIRSAVDRVRSTIIRREFNDRLNRLWRDLFVRLAPGEPFVPAFRVPESSTQKLQPKLITEHRDGGNVGGTPGAMLSAGNLNTAALTLFIALNLSTLKNLPLLILDDPVQSMDDIHIAHFAALLRTLSKEHGRQIVIAVHDRQLFEYLKLELSPAFPEDSLLTLELSRGARRDSVCMSRRYSFKEETALLAIA